jgi:hypothetical protein
VRAVVHSRTHAGRTQINSCRMVLMQNEDPPAMCAGR